MTIETKTVSTADIEVLIKGYRSAFQDAATYVAKGPERMTLELAEQCLKELETAIQGWRLWSEIKEHD